MRRVKALCVLRSGAEMPKSASKKRSREAASSAAPATADGLPSPLDPALAPEWAPMLQALSSLATVAVPSAAAPTMGGSLVRALWQALELQREVERASSTSGTGSTSAGADRDGTSALPHGGRTERLQPLQASLNGWVSAASRRALEYADEAVSSGSLADGALAAWPPGTGQHGSGGASSSGGPRQCGSSMRSGPPTLEELSRRLGDARRDGHDATASAAVSGGAAEAPRGFRDAYMALLAEGAAEQLDALRREGPAMDDAALALLVDALEYGAHSFTPEQRGLFEASF